jgi:putative transcriptional regulator
MAIKCPQCGAEYDVTLFTFGRCIRCDCGAWVDMKTGHEEKQEADSDASQPAKMPHSTSERGEKSPSAKTGGTIMNSLKGHLLIAAPDMPDDDFAETVILLVEHAEDGAYGLILNQPTDLTVRDAWAQSHDTPCLIDAVVYSGGPCGQFLTALHGNQALSNIEVVAGLHYSQEPAKLVQVVEQRVDPVRFFVGFAGWDTGQLEAELEDGSWLSIPASPEHVFAQEDDLWRKLVKQLLGERTLSMLKIKHRPDDLSVN